ncbi:tetratricopeptide repeat protein [Candidatus Omnitrophota bacterium]
MKIIIMLMVITGLCLNIYAEESIEQRLFKDLKKEYNLTDAQTYELLGRTYLHRDKWEEAVIFFDKAVQLDPELYLSWYNLGLLHMDNPELYLKKAIEANSKFAPSYYWLALYYSKGDRITESIEYFEEYLKVVDKNDPIEEARIKVAEDYIKGVRLEE